MLTKPALKIGARCYSEYQEDPATSLKALVTQSVCMAGKLCLSWPGGGGEVLPMQSVIRGGSVRKGYHFCSSSI